VKVELKLLVAVVEDFYPETGARGIDEDLCKRYKVYPELMGIILEERLRFTKQ
jgi:hypothetical protein